VRRTKPRGCYLGGRFWVKKHPSSLQKQGFLKKSGIIIGLRKDLA